jgi:hypothetical protein
VLVSFNPTVSNKQQKQNFGSFPVPKHFGESQTLLDQVGMGKIQPTSDNLESLKKAFKEGPMEIKFHLEEIVDHWKLKLEDFKK